jgi:hypothetical protein
LVVPNIENTAQSVRLLGEPQAQVAVERSGRNLVIHLPDQAPDPVASVVALTLDGPPQVSPLRITPAKDGSIQLPVVLADLHGKHGQRIQFETADGQMHVGQWEREVDFVGWELATQKAGTYRVIFDYAATSTSPSDKRKACIVALPVDEESPERVENIQTAEIQVKNLKTLAKKHQMTEVGITDTGGDKQFTSRAIATVRLPAGRLVLFIYPTAMPENEQLMKLRGVTLQPVDQQ